MLTIASFAIPLGQPRLTHLESQLPPIGTDKSRLAILAALLSYPNAEPKTAETVAELTQYTPQRIRTCLPQLLGGNAVIRCVLINHIRAYSIVTEGSFHGHPPLPSLAAERQRDCDALKSVLTGVRRRAYARRRNPQQNQPDELSVNDIASPSESSRHPPRVSASEETSVKSMQSVNDSTVVATGSQSTDSIGQMETQEVIKRFAEIANRYEAAVSTKLQLEHLGGARPDLDMVTLKQDMLSEAHDTIATMMLETGQLMAGKLDATLCAIASPCSVCFDTMRTPHVFTQCGHAFCQNCCDRIQWTVVNPITMGKECPMCRRISAPIHLFI